MKSAANMKLIVKHTFLEFVEDPARARTRARAHTDSELLSLGYESASTTNDDYASSFSDISVESYQNAWPRATNADAAKWQATAFPSELGVLSSSSLHPQVEQFADIAPRHGAAMTAFDGNMVSSMQCCEGLAVDALASAPFEFSVPSTAGTCSSRTIDRCIPKEQLTTVMMRNLPLNYTRTMLLALLDAEGFHRRYDFVYLPIDFNSQAGLGYAFVNLISEDDAQHFCKCFSGFSRWSMRSEKVCCVNWSRPNQGLLSHIDRYRNSSVMHAQVPDAFKPILLVDGIRVPFPSASRPIKAPQCRLR